MPVTAYLGPEGTFAEQAAHVLAPGDELRSAASVHAAIGALRARQVDAACVPVENSSEGSVPATLDAMTEGEPVLAVAEAVLPIRFSVLVRPGTGAADVRTVATHPHAAAQVRGWLGTHLPSAATVLTASTSAAALAVLDGQADAAVCAPVALQRYPLAELAGGVHDTDEAKTRFLLLRHPGEVPPPTGTDRTSLVAVTIDRPGALLEVLAEFALRGINLTRIESRPMKARLGEYQFFLDCEGHVAQDAVGDALAELRRRCVWVRFLGSYPRVGAPRPGPNQAGFTAAREWLRAVRAGRSA
ncbi:MAG: prephenate dehydratase [Pseudonocardiales bacterium]|nr:prephenate dehydratase [Pseudonocardiales bacterium]MBV9028913.1 prephenate dehydratase [Pseudonocardiales bacterium]